MKGSVDTGDFGEGFHAVVVLFESAAYPDDFLLGSAFDRNALRQYRRCQLVRKLSPLKRLVKIPFVHEVVQSFVQSHRKVFPLQPCVQGKRLIDSFHILTAQLQLGIDSPDGLVSALRIGRLRFTEFATMGIFIAQPHRCVVALPDGIFPENDRMACPAPTQGIRRRHAITMRVGIGQRV